MNLNRFTQKAQEAVINAQELAQELQHQSIEPAHILLALLREHEGIVPAVVTKIAGSVIALPSACAVAPAWRRVGKAKKWRHMRMLRSVAAVASAVMATANVGTTYVAIRPSKVTQG